MDTEEKIIKLLDKEDPRPNLKECIKILQNVLQTFKLELKHGTYY